MTEFILEIIKNFNEQGKIFVKGNRNTIKIFEIEDKVYNVKSFKKPTLIFGILYKFFRKSKAKRSFEYATKLLEKGIKTPKPIGFYESASWLRLKDSYYVCEHLEVDYVFKDLFHLPIAETKEILVQFSRFCFNLHENGIEFLDHSPGNTLIKKNGENNYDFYLVDLNRMKFHETMDINLRMKNLNRLAPNDEFISIISFEYARLMHLDEKYVYGLMKEYTTIFFKKFDKKKRIKKRIIFWKKY